MIRCSRIIYVVPFGKIRDEILTDVAEGISEQFGLQVVIAENQGKPVFALEPARQQYNSQLILKRLCEVFPPDALKILGVTHVDLFSPIFAYVFGEAQFRGKCAVVSTYRLHGNPATAGCPPLVDRLEKEALHELGHTFGLRHCADPNCVMHYSVGLACADRKFPFFCPACRDLVLWHLATDLFLKT
ncbi:MAG: archaemetzincin family Zn-dependent metalloprotease [Syntrophobacteria bacterium]